MADRCLGLELGAFGLRGKVVQCQAHYRVKVGCLESKLRALAGHGHLHETTLERWILFLGLFQKFFWYDSIESPYHSESNEPERTALNHTEPNRTSTVPYQY